MAGICAYGAYVPFYRLSRAEIAVATGGFAQPGEKAVANFDEDSVTMAVEAGRNCLANYSGFAYPKVDGLFFATTTSPFREKQAAVTIATAVDLPREVVTMDCTGTLRSGTLALKCAMDAVNAGTAKEVLVIASDSRLGYPQSNWEQNFGDGAAALLVGNSDVIAEIEGFYTVADEFTDLWRRQEDDFVHSWEERFILTEGFQRVMSEAIGAVLTKYNLTPKDFSKVVYSAPTERAHADIARRLKFDPRTQLQDPLFKKMGHSGTAAPFLQLAAALEGAKPNDRILLASYGNGCDVYILRVTEQIKKLNKSLSVKKQLTTKKMLVNYYQYLNIRNLIPKEPTRQPSIHPPATVTWREQESLLRFRGSRCKKCGDVQYPVQRLCSKCHSKDEYETVRLADQKATVFLASVDTLGYGAETEPLWAIVDFPEGGRTRIQVAEATFEDVPPGAVLEMTFRKFIRQGDVPVYFWKGRLPR
jgi:3-hydroxy-3-methylglutaryl CoA synthase